MRLGTKIFNDPIYGIIEIPYGIIYQLIEHPFYQRLRRINQLGFTQLVYPGATHTRFAHAIGAMHLTQKAIRSLQHKGVQITKEESEGLCIAILLHDVGHGPFSHCLEGNLVQIDHEDISLSFMESLNHIFEGKLSLAIQIFKNEYHKKFLHQLISGQLDMDRMDYLTRDSFFTGVLEGVIGYDRIIKMLNVHEGQLVLEYKGIYSIESFLISRRLMYWQVYLHKTVVCAGEMTIKAIQRARQLIQNGYQIQIAPGLFFFLKKNWTASDLQENTSEILNHFSQIDDIDILSALKVFAQSEDSILSFLGKSLIERRLFKVKFLPEPMSSAEKEKLEHQILQKFQIEATDLHFLLIEGKEGNKTYTHGEKEIMIKLPNQEIKPLSEWSENNLKPQEVIKYFVCHPKLI